MDDIVHCMSLHAADEGVHQVNIETGQRFRRDEIHRDDAPIAKIPPELLAQVFTIYVDAWVYNWAGIYTNQTHRNEDDVGPFYLWIKITHVCRFWHSVACATPSLWRFVVPYIPECMRECLRRSQGVPLYILLREPLVFGVQHLIALQEHRGRIVSVDISYHLGDENMSRWADLFELALPSLKQIGIRHIQCAEQGVHAHRFLRRQRILAFLTRNSRYVERAVLAGFSPSYIDSIFRSQLKHLTLAYSPPFVSMQTYDLLVSCLEESPSLESLVLDRAILPVPSSLSRQQPLKRTATLTNLRYLQVASYAKSPVYVLDHIRYPIDTRVVIDVDCSYRYTAATCEAIGSYVVRKFVHGDDSVGTPSPILTCALNITNDCGLMLWTETFDTLMGPFPPPLLDLHLVNVRSGHSSRFSTLLCELRLSALRTLRLEMFDQACLVGVESVIMRNSSSMEVLHFNGPSVHYAEPILSMLAQSANTTTAEDTCQSPPSSLHIILGPTTTFDAIKAMTAIRSKVGEWYSFGPTQTGIHTRLVEKITFQSPPLNPADADEVLAHAESLVQYGITLRHTPLVSDFSDENKGSLLGAAQNPRFKGAGGDMRVPSGYKLPFI